MPVAPRTRGITMWPAALFLEVPAALLAAAFGLAVDAVAADELEGFVGDPLVAPAVEAAPDAAAEPLITAWTVELKVPDMPLRLFKTLGGARIRRDTTHVNLAENASALNWVWLGSFRSTDVILMKLERRVGDLLGKKIIQHSLRVVVRSNSGIRCPRYRGNLRNINVANRLQLSLSIISLKTTRKRCTEHTCTLWLPTNRPTKAGPNAVRLGVLPSSCHVIVNGLPAGILVEAVGLVILKGYESEIVGRSVKDTDEDGRMRQRSNGSKRKNEERGEHC